MHSSAATEEPRARARTQARAPTQSSAACRGRRGKGRMRLLLLLLAAPSAYGFTRFTNRDPLAHLPKSGLLGACSRGRRPVVALPCGWLETPRSALRCRAAKVYKDASRRSWSGSAAHASCRLRLALSCVVCVCQLLLCPHSRDTTLAGAPEAHTFSQQVSHFNPLLGGTFPQRYWVNASFWSGAGPLFLVLQGEWTASATCASNLFAAQVAAKHGGARRRRRRPPQLLLSCDYGLERRRRFSLL